MDTGKALMDAAPTFFSSKYADSRKIFRAACDEAGAVVEAYPHSLLGPGGESLAIDVARLGPTDASKLLVVISGTHGVEGFAGSGCQVAWLKLRENTDLPEDTAILLVHMLNPWGCAWLRRQNEDNVDLNRNFREFNSGTPDNALYEEIHTLVVNQRPIARAADDPLLKAFREEHGDHSLSAALFSGQYAHSDGVGFGGNHPSWSSVTLRNILSLHARSAERVMVIDIHTGLGPFGYGTLISAEPPGSAALNRARAFLGRSVISVSEDGAVPYEIGGNLLSWVSSSLKSEVTSVALEFGTLELAKLLELQVDDCRMRLSPDAWAAFSNDIRNELLRFFFPGTIDWIQSVVTRALQVISSSIDGLQKR